MREFPDWLRFSFRKPMDDFWDWVVVEFGPFFDTVTAAVLYVLVRLERGLLAVPWWLVLLIIGAVAWHLTRRWLTALSMMALMLIVGSLGMWDLAMSTLALIGVSVLLAIVIGIPTGILMARSDLVQAFLRPVLDAMQTFPIFVYLIPAMMLFGLGKVSAIFATLIYSVPPVIRLTNLGIRQVDHEVVEAAEAYGSTRRQTLFGVQLPLALPTIMAGINQTTMMALAMVVIAAMIGARGLGEQVLLAIQRLEVGRGFEAGLSIVALAIIIDRLTQAYARRTRVDEES